MSSSSYSEHKVIIDSSISVNIEIPYELSAIELKGIMDKANKLFKLSDANTIEPQMQGKNFQWSEELTKQLKEMYQKGFSVSDITEELNIPGLDKQRVYSKIYWMIENEQMKRRK